ncbi:MAG: T9SS type A sorting domain-containing protein [Ignavibacteria bacterium]|nr:T9SS type A sorting domain-containing protein [Ignavibacteria bacterium]
MQTGFVLATGPYNNTFASVLKTTDGGYSWDYVYDFESFLFLNEIKFFDQLNGIAVGTFDDLINSYGVVLRTTNGGDDWIRTALPQLLSLNSVTNLSINSILISGVKTDFSAAIFRSDDGGITWFECCTYSDQHFINGINSVPSAGVIIVYGVYQPTGSAIPFIEATIDNGASWHYNLLSQFPDYYLTKSKLVDDSRWYITGTQFAQIGFVLFTDNAGGVPVELTSFTADVNSNKVQLQWQTASELNNLGFEIERKTDKSEWRIIGFEEGKGTTTEIQNYIFIDDLFGIESEHLYYRLKQIDLDGKFEYSDIVEVKVERLNEYLLTQNYPNPFNPKTIIKYQIPELSFVTLKVYDVLGSEVATLVSEEKVTGTYEITWYAEKLPSGIYFYRLQSLPTGRQAGSFVETKKMVLMK